MKKKIWILIVSAVILSHSFYTVPIFANSAQTHFQGVDSTGAIITDIESPIRVEKEVLTFDIAEFPKNYYQSSEEYLSYGAKVTAEYTFYNPSSYTVTAKLLFPFGNAPHYAGGEYDDLGNYSPFNDTNKFDVSVNGKVIEKNIRHTLSSLHDQFVLEQDLAFICDGFAKDDFYSQDLTVTKYTFKVNGVDTEKYPASNVGFDISKGIGNYRIYFPEQNGAHSQKNGKLRIHTNVGKNGRKFELYVFGTPLSKAPTWKIYEDGGVENKDEISGKVELLDTQTMTFKELALSNRSETSAVSESDWYNAFVFELNDSIKNSNYPVVDAYRFENGFIRYFMRWYEYEITLSPGERIVNTVTAPIYPAIDMSYTPDIFEYTYLLSPAKTWENFGDLEIVINTPFYLIDYSIGGFEKAENGYTLTLNSLPDGELIFTLSTSADPQKPIKTLTDYVPIEIIISFSVIGGAVALICISTVIIVKRKKSKKE